MDPGFGPVPPAARHRLIRHYGTVANGWLDNVPEAIGQTAAEWKLTITGYHDAGHASVLALAIDSGRARYVIKAWYDRCRYHREVAALRCWSPGLAPAVVSTHDQTAVAAIEMIASKPGGAPAPDGEYAVISRGIRRLHSQVIPSGEFPCVSDYIEGEIRPRIRRRAALLGSQIPQSCLEQGLAALGCLADGIGEPVLLHGDLYKENILFTLDGTPMFIDPLPMLGSRLFDWAFFTVYYDLSRDPVERLLAAAGVCQIPARRLVPWCLVHCLDGLLYYIDTADARAPRMIAVMRMLGRIWTETRS